MSALSHELLEILCCPKSKSRLTLCDDTLRSDEGAHYPIIDGIPCFHTAPGARTWKHEVSLLILTLNEEANIRALLEGAISELEKTGLSFEIVIIDGGSLDRTTEIATALGARVFTQEKSGYAEALIEGMRRIEGKFLITLDGDLSHPVSLIPKLLAERHASEVIIGSRWMPGGSFAGPQFRKILSIILNTFFRRALSLSVRDLSSGYRLYHSRILTPDDYQSRDFSILEEVVVKAYTDGFTIKEVPMEFQVRHSGTSHVRLFKFAISYLATLWRMWLLRNDANGCDYDSRAYDSPVYPQRYWQRKRFKNIASLLGRYRSEGAVLDIGCGSSRIIQSLRHAVAYDLSLRKLRYLRPTNRFRVSGSAFTLPFKDNSFDCIIHSQLIEHLPFEESLFSELARILKPGGSLIIGTVDYASWTWPTIERIYGWVLPNAYADEHITHYTLRSLTEILEARGFRLIQVKTILKGEITLLVEKTLQYNRNAATTIS